MIEKHHQPSCSAHLGCSRCCSEYIKVASLNPPPKRKKTLFSFFQKDTRLARLCVPSFSDSLGNSLCTSFMLNGTWRLHVILAVPQLDLKSICSLDCPGYRVLTFPWHLFHTNKTICVRAKATNYSEKCGSVGSDAPNGLFFLFCHNPFLTSRCSWTVEVSVLKSRLSMLQSADTMHFQFVLIFYGFIANQLLSSMRGRRYERGKVVTKVRSNCPDSCEYQEEAIKIINNLQFFQKCYVF